MSPMDPPMGEEHPVHENIRSLEQGIALMRRLDDATYSRSPESIGSQVRHCVDFYGCFLRGLDARRIDYTSRNRERRVELEREFSIRCVEELIARLPEAVGGQTDADVMVRAESLEGDEESGWCCSSVQRELQFLLSHTIHHYALIVRLLELQGVEPGEEFAEFGVAPSTLRHWKTMGSMSV